MVLYLKLLHKFQVQTIIIDQVMIASDTPYSGGFRSMLDASNALLSDEPL
jgi:hypothetical protein